MKKTMELEFEDWFGIYFDRLRKLGWQGSVDMGSAECDYENDISPEDAAQAIWDDLLSDESILIA